MAEKSLIVELGAENRDLRQKVDQAKATLNQYGDAANKQAVRSTAAFDKMNTSIKAIGSSIAGAFAAGAIMAFSQQSIDAYNQQVKAEKALLFALSNRIDLQRDLLQQSEDLRRTTGVDDAAIISAQKFSLAQGRTVEQTKKLTVAAVDLAAVLGTSVEDAAKQLNMTYEGQTRGVARLDSRIKDLSKTQLENGAAVDILAQKYKGFGAASATGLDRARSDWGEFMEWFGKKWGDFAETIAGTELTPGAKMGQDYAANFMKGLEGMAKTDQIKKVRDEITRLNAETQSFKPDDFKTYADYLGTLQRNGQAIEELSKLQKGLRGDIIEETSRMKQSNDAQIKRNEETIKADKEAAESAALRAGIIGGLNYQLEQLSDKLAKAKTAGEISITTEQIERVKALQAAYQNLNENLKEQAEPELELGAGMGDQIEADAKAFEERKKQSEDFTKQLEANAQSATDTVSELMDQQSEAILKASDVMQAYQAAVASGFMNMGQSVVDGLGLAEDGFEGFLKSLLEATVRMLAMALAQAMANAIVGGSAAGAAAGPLAPLAMPAAIAATTGAVTDAFSGIPSFATGGAVYGPQLALIGDNPGRREYIIPSEVMDRMQPGWEMGSQRIIVEGRIKGEDIFITNQRYTGNRSRWQP